MKRNFEVFQPLDFLAEVTQHIPNRGEHQFRYYGWYSNKMRGQKRAKRLVVKAEENEKNVQKISPRWAMLIRCVFEVDPLECPGCGEKMRIVSFIEKKQSIEIERILRHCGLWVERQKRGPPKVERRLVEFEGA